MRGDAICGERERERIGPFLELVMLLGLMKYKDNKIGLAKMKKMNKNIFLFSKFLLKLNFFRSSPYDGKF